MFDLRLFAPHLSRTLTICSLAAVACSNSSSDPALDEMGSSGGADLEPSDDDSTGGDPGDSDDGPGDDDDPIAASLRRLGVDITPTPRRATPSDTLPDDFAPLGSRAELAKIDELFVVGVDLVEAASPAAILELETDTRSTLVALTEPNWDATPGALRRAIASDTDGDGLDESYVVYAGPQGDLRVHGFADQERGFETSDQALLSAPSGLTRIETIAGDLDGDGDEEFVAALVVGDTVRLVVVDRLVEDFTIVFDGVLELPAFAAQSEIEPLMAAGNIDWDAADELAIVVNAKSEQYAASFIVLDDLSHELASLRGGPIVGATSTGNYVANLADVSMGDIDRDGRDEILLGGLTNATTGSSCDSRGHVLVALDDATAALAQRDAVYFDHYYQDCPDYSPHRIGTVHVNALDLDGDGADEVQFNQFVFGDLDDAARLEVRYEMPENVWMFSPNGSNRFDRSTTAVAVGDVTGDERADIVTFSASAWGNVRVWSLDAIDGWTERAPIETATYNSDNASWPQLAMSNVDRDSLVLRYEAPKYELVFTEPVILAALAAPPCNDAIDQNLDACRTAFGVSTSETTEQQVGYTISASATFGFGVEAEFFGVGVESEVTATISASAGQYTSTAYTLEKSITYTSGPLEDTVIFTTIPYDQYTYVIASHPDPELIGTEVIVSLPREPITLMVEREFYNDNVAAGSVLVGDGVFTHRIGEPSSYASRSEQQAILAQREGIASDLVAVGQGTGDISVGVNVATEQAEGTTYSVSAEFEARTTALGVIAGFSIGAGLDAELRIAHGQASDYAGTVGQIAADDFIGNDYRFGLFSYVRNDPQTGHAFEVIDYWVE